MEMLSLKNDANNKHKKMTEAEAHQTRNCNAMPICFDNVVYNCFYMFSPQKPYTTRGNPIHFFAATRSAMLASGLGQTRIRSRPRMR